MNWCLVLITALLTTALRTLLPPLWEAAPVPAPPAGEPPQWPAEEVLP